ncbi:Transposase [Desulfonatronospira thiodismutans ASO3-1]|uniref:Transposase n=2 Tax=Desulfonatronospira thiodismutans TaxID=488939 RepID=D6SN24_9BACT|nr:Transposase [Desulfonatronospira thiodismutans ASO3-1]EFI33391.1 Transposase [Desulfonatronospira thiodismutans ASO3-1]EFI36085.1 Transposase [Desulfonatronospira thiodismutans ASO3-1]
MLNLGLTYGPFNVYVYTEMATIQKKPSRGRDYWAIVESRRINGKPRPVVLEHLGTAENLLKRLQEGAGPHKVKSYSHGLVAYLLNLIESLDLVQIINRHVPNKQIRDGFTVGGSIVLASMGRICQPTSKRNWYKGWAKRTSLSYLLRMSLAKIDSQHFWDQMDALPSETIPAIEEEIVDTLYEHGLLSMDTLLYDTSNFFTYIASTNERCTLAKRGKNKQRRIDLRQFGLLLLVSRQDQLPIYHRTYQGNLNDKTVFKEHFARFSDRLKRLSGSLEDITVVLDQGNNSKKMLKEVDQTIYFVGALSVHQHRHLVERANLNLQEILIGNKSVPCYKERTTIWGSDLTAVVYISEKLRDGQIRGLEQGLSKLCSELDQLKEAIKMPTQKGKKRTEAGIQKKIDSLISSCVPKGIVEWELTFLQEDAFELQYWIDYDHLEELKKWRFGRRILITNRHHWSTEEIIKAYWGQANIEYVFKNMKNPFHMAWRPQYHWTDQKIEVHGFICLVAFLLVMVAFKHARENAGFSRSPHTLLEKLSEIRLATLIDAPTQKSKGRYRATYQLEEMDPDVKELADAMGIAELPMKSKIPFSVYKS